MIFHWTSIAALTLGFGTIPSAPLPEGLAPSGEAKVRGLYAEAGYGRIDVNEAVEQLESGCADRGAAAKIEGRGLLWSGKRRIYRSRESIAVFEDTPTIAADPKACTARISLVRSIRVTAASRDDLLAAGCIEGRPKCGRFVNRCTNETVAGVKAICVNLGDGLVGSTVCYSIQHDLSRDLALQRSNYTDDGSGPDNSWGLDIVLTDALIDPVVFRRAT